MRILHLIPSLSGGGAERQLSYLAPELSRMGHEIHIVYSKEGPQRPELPGVMLHQLKSRSNYDLSLLWQVVRLIRRIKPDLIHTWIRQMDILGGLAARVCGIPWILREPSSGLAYGRCWKNMLRVWIGTAANAVVSNSQGGDNYWKAKSPKSRRYVVTNGLPLHLIEEVNAGLPDGIHDVNVPIVLYVGRLDADKVASKNLARLLKALALIKGEQKVIGIICGEGSQRSELECLRHELDLDSDVLFTGYLPAAAVWAMMKKAAVFVSLSDNEGRPNAVLEAMACGCPVIVSDIPAHREILNDKSAIFVQAYDVQHIGDSISLALSNLERSGAFAANARIRSKEWTVAKIAHDWEFIYGEILKRRISSSFSFVG